MVLIFDDSRESTGSSIHIYVGHDQAEEQSDEITSLVAILPPEVNIQFPTTYYRHLVSIFEKSLDAEEVIYFARLAITYSDDQLGTQDLWLKCHKAHLDLGLYEEAYIVMNETPFPELLV